MLAANFPRVLADPHDLEARAGMQLGACLAGLAIENSMLGATHALANPLTANYGIVHGQAIASMLPHVIRYNGEQYGVWYLELYRLLNDHAEIDSPAEAVDRLSRRVCEWTDQAKLGASLAEQGVVEESLPQLAREASEQWTATFNPRDITPADGLKLYRAAFSAVAQH